MTKFFLWAIVLILCWPLAIVGGVIWLVVACIKAVTAVMSWFLKPPKLN